MADQILATKLYIPPPRPNVVSRARLIEQLNEGLPASRRLALVSAPAGFGKTTLLGEWAAACGRPAAWLSLDEEDNDPARFLAYFVAALRTVAADSGAGVLSSLQSPQPPPFESVLTALVNEIAAIPDKFIMVLDDYHAIDAKAVDGVLAFLVEHLPPQMHLVIATREDPRLPLARLRAGGQMTELRAADLRFTPGEAAGFLNQVMGLNLSEEDIATLETRTEGWIAGLQLAAISMQGNKDTSGFIKSFTGSHRFVLDYLVEEVLRQQPENVQTFLLRTSILDRMCGPLCEAVMQDGACRGQETLEYLEQANLFTVPLDNERRWYRYHHLFAELLRQQLSQSAGHLEAGGVNELHRRASQWYEDNGMDIEAFHHATAAGDIERAECLIEGKGTLLHFRGAVIPVLNWLESLPTTVLDKWPSLWTTYASVALVARRATNAEAEEKLRAAEKALQNAEMNAKNRDLIGRIAAIRATMAGNQRQMDTLIDQSQRALEYLHPNNLSFRTFTSWKLGFAYEFQGDRPAAKRAYTEAVSLSEASGNVISTIMGTIGLGSIQALENQLYQSAETYRRVLELAGDPPLPVANEAHFALGWIYYEWNDLVAAQQHAQLSLRVGNLDRVIDCNLLLAHLKLANGDAVTAADILAKSAKTIREHNFLYLIPKVTASQVFTLLQLGDLEEAAELAEAQDIPLSRARVHLAQGNAAAALAALEPFCQQMAEKGWVDRLLKATVLQAVALNANGQVDRAVKTLGDALAMAEPGGFVRTFVDEGPAMAELLGEAAERGILPDYTAKLLAAFKAEGQKRKGGDDLPAASGEGVPAEPLSQREIEILKLIALGLSNSQIGERLFLALDTVKGHNRRIFDKLQAQNRTEAVARARELGLV